jgi:hypothetical protein
MEGFRKARKNKREECLFPKDEINFCQPKIDLTD